MTPTEHYDKAEEILLQLTNVYGRDSRAEAIGVAQIHATLALFVPPMTVTITKDNTYGPTI